MARRILGRPALIAKSWPHRALNFLPPKQLWKYLSWKSGNLGKESAFSLGKSLADCRRILVLAPETFQEILIAIPVLQSLAFELPESELQILAHAENTDFLAGIFASEKVVGINTDEFYWGEPHLRELEVQIRNYKPNLVLNFRTSTSPLLSYIIGVSKANLRAQICTTNQGPENEAIPFPFINIRLRPTEQTNHLRRYLLATSLWNFAPAPLACRWTRFKPGTSQTKEALARLLAKGLRPESTRLFLWQGENSLFQQEVFKAAVTERHGPGESKSLAILVATGNPFSIALPSADQTGGIPCLEAESTGLLLAFFSQTNRSIGINSPLLHLASLSETDVEAHFEPGEEPWDTAFLNARFKVIYRNTNTHA
jgi:hypothetical protein